MGMHTGDWFGLPETHRKDNNTFTNFQRFHQEAQEEAQTIAKERKDVIYLNQHIAEIEAESNRKIEQINLVWKAKITNLRVERDLEVNLVREQAEKLTTHIKNTCQEEDQAIAAPVEDQAITAPVKAKYAVKLKR